MKKKTIGIYGLGRFGSFWASLFTEDFTVIGYNRTPRDIHIDGVQLVSEDELLSADALFICVAISSFEAVIQSVSSRIKPGTIVFDTCSVKCYPADIMKSNLPEGVSSIATHPMFGPDSAKDGVKGLPMVFSPLECGRDESRYWYKVFEGMGMKMIEMSPDEHDSEAAETQGITHVIGRVLGEMHLEESPIATKGYSKLMEIVEQTCNDPYQLFMDLQHYNPYTHDMRGKLKRSLDKTMKALSDADPIRGGDCRP